MGGHPVEASSTPAKFTALNSIVLAIIEKTCSQSHFMQDEMEANQLHEALNALQDWADTKKNELANGSLEDKAILESQLLFEMEAALKIYLYFNRNLPDFSQRLISLLCSKAIAILVELSSQESLLRFLQQTAEELHEKLDFPVIEGNVELRTRVLLGHAIQNAARNYGAFNDMHTLGWSLEFPKEEIDLAFLNTHFDWAVTTPSVISSSTPRITQIVQIKENKTHFFQVAFAYGDSLAELPLYIDLVGRYSPFPHATMELILKSFNEKGILYIDNQRGWYRIQGIDTKEKLGIAAGILVHYGHMPDAIATQLDETIGYCNPAQELKEQIARQDYDQAIAIAVKKVKLGFKDCLWNLANDLGKQCIFDKAYQAYNTIDKDSPYYKEAKLKAFHILNQLLFSDFSLTKQEIIDYKERQFILLLDLCNQGDPDPQIEKLKDALFSDLCGKTGLYGFISQVNTNSDTLLTLARELRASQQQQKRLEEENARLKEQVKAMTQIKTTSALEQHGIFATTVTPTTTLNAGFGPGNK